MAIVFVSKLLREAVPAERLEVPGSTVGDVIRALGERYPAALDILLGEDGDIAPGIAVVIDDQVGQLGMFDEVGEGTELHFLPALSGGG